MDATEPREMSSVHGLPQLSLLAIWIFGAALCLAQNRDEKEGKQRRYGRGYIKAEQYGKGDGEICFMSPKGWTSVK